MEHPRATLRRLQQQHQQRDAVKLFELESRNGATVVDLRYQTTWVRSELLHLMRSDNVRISSMQPTEQLNCRFEIDLTEPFDDIILENSDG